MLQLIDNGSLFLAAFVPVYCVLRWNLKGVFIGAVLFWIILLVAGLMLAALDPERGSSVLDGVWLLIGWLAGLMYCFPTYGGKRLFLYLRARGTHETSA